MYPSVSDFTRIKKLQNTLQSMMGRDLVSSTLPGCINSGTSPCSTRKTDMGLVGKLKTVREVSKYIDFKATQTQNFLLYSQYSGDQTNANNVIQVPTYDANGSINGYTAGTNTAVRGGFGRQIKQIQMGCANTGSCTTPLPTKVGPLKSSFLNRNRL